MTLLFKILDPGHIQTIKQISNVAILYIILDICEMKVNFRVICLCILALWLPFTFFMLYEALAVKIKKSRKHSIYPRKESSISRKEKGLVITGRENM